MLEHEGLPNLDDSLFARRTDIVVAMTDVSRTLNQIESGDPTAAQVVKLRFFAGLTIKQTAESLQISVQTANRHWAYAKAWIYQQISSEVGNPENH